MLEKKREGILEDLQHTKMRITEISNQYGFDSLSHFATSSKTLLETLPVPYGKELATAKKLGRSMIKELFL